RGPKASEWIQRFNREARAAAALDQHPNICQVYDVGKFEDQPYLTMAYIEGKPLSANVAPGRPLPVAKAVEVVRRLAVALEKAHAKGVVHRDLKPSNIMMRADGGGPVVMDFGLAWLSGAEEVPLTATGATLGTPAYMAPEQVRGEAREVGPLSDVYS